MTHSEVVKFVSVVFGEAKPPSDVSRRELSELPWISDIVPRLKAPSSPLDPSGIPYDFLGGAEGEEIPFLIGAYALAALGVGDGDAIELMADIFVGVCQSLTEVGGYHQYRFKVLTLEQCSAIARTLEVIANDSDGPEDRSQTARAALDGFWGCLLTKYDATRLG